MCDVNTVSIFLWGGAFNNYNKWAYNKTSLLSTLLRESMFADPA